MEARKILAKYLRNDFSEYSLTKWAAPIQMFCHDKINNLIDEHIVATCNLDLNKLTTAMRENNLLEIDKKKLGKFISSLKVLKITKVIRQYHAKLIRLLYLKIRIILKGKIEPNFEFSFL